MVNQPIIIIGGFALLAILIAAFSDYIVAIYLKTINFLLPKKSKSPSSEYICPRCSSKKWKFPNPIKPGDSMINIPQLVNNFLECMKCGYIGIFFLVDKKKVGNIKISKKSSDLKKKEIKEKGLIFIFLSAFLIYVLINLIGLAGGTLFGVMGTLALMKAYGAYKNSKKKYRKRKWKIRTL